MYIYIYIYLAQVFCTGCQSVFDRGIYIYIYIYIFGALLLNWGVRAFLTEVPVTLAIVLIYTYVYTYSGILALYIHLYIYIYLYIYLLLYIYLYIYLVFIYIEIRIFVCIFGALVLNWGERAFRQMYQSNWQLFLYIFAII